MMLARWCASFIRDCGHDQERDPNEEIVTKKLKQVQEGTLEGDNIGLTKHQRRLEKLKNYKKRYYELLEKSKQGLLLDPAEIAELNHRKNRLQLRAERIKERHAAAAIDKASSDAAADGNVDASRLDDNAEEQRTYKRKLKHDEKLKRRERRKKRRENNGDVITVHNSSAVSSNNATIVTEDLLSTSAVPPARAISTIDVNTSSIVSMRNDNEKRVVVEGVDNAGLRGGDAAASAGTVGSTGAVSVSTGVSGSYSHGLGSSNDVIGTSVVVGNDIMASKNSGTSTRDNVHHGSSAAAARRLGIEGAGNSSNVVISIGRSTYTELRRLCLIAAVTEGLRVVTARSEATDESWMGEDSSSGMYVCRY
jgi:hypothetical protein